MATIYEEKCTIEENTECQTVTKFVVDRKSKPSYSTGNTQEETNIIAKKIAEHYGIEYTEGNLLERYTGGIFRVDCEEKVKEIKEIINGNGLCTSEVTWQKNPVTGNFEFFIHLMA